MSYNTLDAASKDPFLANRVVAATAQEAFENPGLPQGFAAAVRANPAEGVRLVWPTAIATEAEYASALAAGNPNPGGDEAVITDAMILAAVQTNWPPDAP